MENHSSPVSLTVKETEILTLIAIGYSNNEAAAKLGKSLSAFNKQLANTRQKLNARTKEQAVVKALELRLIAI